MKKIIFLLLIYVFYVFFIFSDDKEDNIKKTQYIEDYDIIDLDFIQDSNGNCFLIYQNQFLYNPLLRQYKESISSSSPITSSQEHTSSTITLPWASFTDSIKSEVIMYKENHYNSNECKKIYFDNNDNLYANVYATSRFYKIKENGNHALCFTGTSSANEGTSSANEDKKIFIFAAGSNINNYFTKVIPFSHYDDLDIKNIFFSDDKEISILYLVNQNLCMSTINLENGNEIHKFIFSGYIIDNIKIRKMISKEYNDYFYGIFTSGNNIYSFLIKENNEITTKINLEYSYNSDCFYDFADELDSCFIISHNSFYEINYNEEITIIKYEKTLNYSDSFVKSVVNSKNNAVILIEDDNAIIFQNIDLKNKQIKDVNFIRSENSNMRILLIDKECLYDTKPYVYILLHINKYIPSSTDGAIQFEKIPFIDCNNNNYYIRDYYGGNNTTFRYIIKAEISLDGTTVKQKDISILNNIHDYSFWDVFLKQNINLIKNGVCWQYLLKYITYRHSKVIAEELITQKFELCLERDINTGNYFYTIRKNDLISYPLLKKDHFLYFTHDSYTSAITDTINGLFYVFNKIGNQIIITSRID